ncbi:MAG: transglycosylase SLT domain-containing protein [Acidaminobacteraceae bacterium]
MKKSISLMLIFVLLLSFATVSSAEETRQVAEIISENITINEEKITSLNMRFEMFTIDDVLYYPISYNSLDAVGLAPSWDSETNSIVLTSAEKKGFNDSNWIKSNRDNSYIKAKTDVTINAKSFSSVANPVYEINNVLYIPLTDENMELLGWFHIWDKNVGLVIDTTSKENLDEYISSITSADDLKIAEFMQNINSDLSEEEAMYYVKLISDSSEKYEIDKLWFTSMMWVESNFDKDSEYKGAIGLMQIMTSTGKSLGLTKEQLFIPEYSIEYGAKYLNGNIDRYDGNIKKATSAYNQGVTRVDKGSYSTWYVDIVEERLEKLTNYIDN